MATSNCLVTRSSSNYLFCVFNRSEKLVQVWNNLRVSKLWQICLFWVNYLFKCVKTWFRILANTKLDTKLSIQTVRCSSTEAQDQIIWNHAEEHDCKVSHKLVEFIQLKRCCHYILPFLLNYYADNIVTIKKGGGGSKYCDLNFTGRNLWFE